MEVKSLLITSSLVAAFIGLNVQAQSQSQDPKGSSSDAKFVQKAAEANLTEVELGKLAAQKSQNGQVKQFAEHLQMEHQDANTKLQPIAQTQGVQIPTTLDSKHQREINRLQKLTGAEFDKEFAKTALRDHAQTITLFQKEAQQGQDSATKQYAQTTVSALQKHLDMAKDVAKNVGLDETTISSILKEYPEATGGASTPGGQGQGVSTNKSGY